MRKDRTAKSNRIKDSRVFPIVNGLAMVLFCVIILYPVLNVAAISLSADAFVYSGSVSFYPKGFQTGAYEMVMASASLWRSFLNSIFVAFVGTALSLVFTCLAAYPMAFGNFYGKKLYVFLIMLTMWFGGGMIPTFLVMTKLKLVNTLWSLIVLSLIGAYNVVVLRTSFHSIPKSLIESAQIDGANDFVILSRIVVPLSMATLATIGLWSIVGHWNSFTNPLIYLKDYSQYTLQVVLRDIVLSTNGSEMFGIRGIEDSSNVIPEQIRNATIVIAMIPMLIIYPFLQRYFVKGVMIGSVKE